MKRYVVYAISDPRTSLPVYVGVTTRKPSVRLAEHRCHAKRRNPQLEKWFETVADAGLKPGVLILEVNPPDGMNAEMRWIGSFRMAGHKLLNIADGGQGPNGVAHTEEWKLNNSRLITGMKRSAETRKRIADSKMGKPRPDLAARNKASATLSDEQVADIRLRLAKGEKGVALAAEFGISTAWVSLIKKNKRRS